MNPKACCRGGARVKETELEYIHTFSRSFASLDKASVRH